MHGSGARRADYAGAIHNFVDDDIEQHNGDDESRNAVDAAVDNDVAKHDQHDADAGGWRTNDDDDHQYDDNAWQLPHASCSR